MIMVGIEEKKIVSNIEERNDNVIELYENYEFEKC